MSTAYFGLICRHCKTAYPLGQEMHRDLKYQLDLGPFGLECFHCGQRDVYSDMAIWEHESTYSPTVIATSRQRVRRAKRSFQR